LTLEAVRRIKGILYSKLGLSAEEAGGLQVVEAATRLKVLVSSSPLDGAVRLTGRRSAAPAMTNVPEGVPIPEQAENKPGTDGATPFAAGAQRPKQSSAPLLDGSFGTDDNPNANVGDRVTEMTVVQPQRPRPTILYLGEKAYSIGDSGAITVTDSEHAILQEFIAVPGMDTESLQTKSGNDRAPRILRGLATKYGSAFAPAIRLPGGKGKGGYHVSIQDVRPRRA
jgi:hypothetical protein